MTEEVPTGGLVKFRYDKSLDGADISPEMKRGIEEGYKAAEARKKAERRNKIIFWIIGLMIALAVFGIIGCFALK
jgi:type IV secretory pathway component VirB8